MLELARAKNDIVRKDISKADALAMFGERGEEYKCELISELEKNQRPADIFRHYRGDQRSCQKCRQKGGLQRFSPRSRFNARLALRENDYELY